MAAACAWCGKASGSAEEIVTKEGWLEREALLKCSACHSIAYCTRACQKRHWSLHRRECAQLRAKWVAGEATRKAERERAAEARRAELERDVALVRTIIADFEAGVERLDPSASVRWSQKRPGRIEIVEVWLHGKKYAGFETVTKHSSAEALVKSCEFRVATGTVGYGCPCHGFNLMLMNSQAASNQSWAPCPFGGAGAAARRPLAPASFAGNQMGVLGVGGVVRSQPPADALGVAPGFAPCTFSCEPCDPEEAARAGLGAPAAPLVAVGGGGTAGPQLCAAEAQGLVCPAEAQGLACPAEVDSAAPLAPPSWLGAVNGFSCTPCDPDEEAALARRLDAQMGRSGQGPIKLRL